MPPGESESLEIMMTILTTVRRMGGGPVVGDFRAALKEAVALGRLKDIEELFEIAAESKSVPDLEWFTNAIEFVVSTFSWGSLDEQMDDSAQVEEQTNGSEDAHIDHYVEGD